MAEERPGDPVEALRGHIDAAHAAADRLVREATERATAADRAFRERLGEVPERGWPVPGQSGGEAAVPAPAPQTGELQLALRLLDAVRDVIPAEISAQLAEAVRELLLAVRALIDWYLERLERGPGRPEADDRVEEIPIS